MKKLVFLIAVCSALMITMSAEKMDDNGKAGYTGSPGELNCTDCHDTYVLNSGGGSVSLTSTNMTNWVYDPGVTYHMVATVTRTSNELFGICVEALLPGGANAGTLVQTNTVTTQIKTKTVNGTSRRSVVHKLDAGQGVDSFAFTFDWTAPATNSGDVTFYFAGNASDFDGNESGDYIYIDSRVCAFNLSNNINSGENNSLMSVYPMPIQDHFNLNYNLNSTGPVNIKLYSIKGELVSILSSQVMAAGQHTDNFYLPNRLSSGNYIISIESSAGITCQKVLIN
ncbi:MAG: T9SS type A sorting domain-containing protein [Bacteroidetes bacterium]|nr:T9SS type A sorting domain-containing protein [Bacteroidota bacterium]